MPALLSRVRAALAFLLIIIGAGGVVAGALAPWAIFKLFKTIDVGLPGLFFVDGSLCLAVAALVLWAGRRVPMLCLLGALFLLNRVQDARLQVPFRVKHQILGSQIALFPVNRLLNQFHIDDIQVGEWSVPNAQLLGPGVGWTETGSLILLLGSLVGLPGDPVAVWVYTRTARVRCRACGARWRAARQAYFCPVCGTSVLVKGQHLCRVCHGRVKVTDHYCVACGTPVEGFEEQQGER